ncbi:hypothetical protein NE237_031393 [Protea cynaroides]|uniref:TIR domain-containing protein n=1 Tax=Protea cynaroides TaxID=273540 RepID=A0A9Q0L2D2_9MAGN|nr:hypothetical protein NE237_031393 [Protea cynaroides]
MAASSDSCNYEIFISYKWDMEGTSRNFSISLFERLRVEKVEVFLDSQCLERGEDMLPKFIHAIRKSKILIPIISKGYSESQWCLNELTEMVDSYESGGQKILPILFDVEADHVNKHIGIDTALSPLKENKKKNHKQIKDGWGNALTAVAKLLAYTLKEVNGNHSKLVNLIVGGVLTELSCLAAAKYPVGLFGHVKEIEKRLCCPDHVQYFGIHGAKGIGKTTIAKALHNRYSREFDYKCFLENIGTNTSEVIELQKQLIKSISKEEGDVLIPDVGTGKKKIKGCLHGKKVLIILDGVESENQFKALNILFAWFDIGSKIIVTSRFEKILKLACEAFLSGTVYKVDEKRIFHLPKLDEKQSFQLFNRRAFPKEQFREVLDKEVFKMVVLLAEGLPSNAVKLAERLSDKISNIELCQRMLNELKEISGSDLDQKLQGWDDNAKKKRAEFGGLCRKS